MANEAKDDDDDAQERKTRTRRNALPRLPDGTKKAFVLKAFVCLFLFSFLDGVENTRIRRAYANDTMKHNSRLLLLLLLLLLLFTVRFVEQEDDENQQHLAEDTVVFSKASDRSNNGVVSVAAYGPNWRSLLLNEVEQGLAWVDERTNTMDGTALAREYLRTMAAMTVAHAMMGQSSSSFTSKREKDAMLMIGLGSGALPFFMETHFKNAFEMETVEHDPVVVEAIERTCFNNKKIPFRCVIDDAREYLETKIAKDSLDVISMDAFDGEGNVPERLVSREFFRLCSEKLKSSSSSSSSSSKERSSMFIMNCFNGVRGSTAREFVHVICARLEKSIGPVMTIPVYNQPCNVIVVALKRVDECREENEDARFRYARDTLVRLAREGFERGNAKEWDAGEKVEGIFWVVDADERKKTMREIEPNKNTRHFFTRTKKEGKYRGRNGTYMPKEFADIFEVYEGQITDAHSRDNNDDYDDDGYDDDDDEKR